MKNKKRIISAVMIIAMLFSVCLSSSVSAAEKATVSGTFVTCSESSGEAALSATVTFLEESGKVHNAAVSESEGLGTYSALLPAGIYDVTISKPGYLSYTVSGVRVGNIDVAIPELSVLAGDLDGDGKINTKDLAVFLRGFSTDEKYADIRALADFDEDGTLTVSDLGAIKPNNDTSKETYEWTNVMKLQTDFRYNPLGIDYTAPEFGWAMESTKRGEKQTAYRIGVASTREKAILGEYDIWDSGKVVSNETRAIYGEIVGEDGTTAAELAARTQYFWTVTAFGADGKEIPASDIATFETALFGDFGADNKWISFDKTNVFETEYTPATTYASILFRKQFALSQSLENVAKARLYSTAAGNQIMYMNGERASDEYFAPGKSQFITSMFYQTYDVTDLILDGDNTIAAEVGQGWYNAGAVCADYGDNVALKAKLVITYNDGTEQVIDTDGSWLATNDGPTYTNKFYIGQHVDARKKIDKWNENDCTFENFIAATASDKHRCNGLAGELYVSDNFIAANMEPVRNTHVFNPTSVTNPEEGVYIYKLDQNIAGTVRLTAKAPAGTKIRLRFTEFLNKEGRVESIIDVVYGDHNGNDEYIFRGDENGETVEFDLVYHGFQYIQIEGLSEALPFENIEALVLTSDMEQTGYVEFSNKTLSQFVENLRWTMRGNFVSTLTDCPTREKNTWTGDAQLISGSASFLANTFNHYRNLQNMALVSQFGDGGVPEILPGHFIQNENTTTGSQPSAWGDAIVLVPWEMYNQFGDVTILEDSYEAMKKWIGYLLSRTYIQERGGTEVDLPVPYYLDESKIDYVRIDGVHGDHMATHRAHNGRGYLDWNGTPGTASKMYFDTSLCEVGTAFTAYSCSIVAKVAEILGKDESEVAYYNDLHDKYAKGWRDNFVAEDGYTSLSDGETTLVGGNYVYNSDISRKFSDGNIYENIGTQTSYCMGLYFDLYENEEMEKKAAENLVKLLERENYSITVGIIGINYIFPVLTKYGYHDIAMKVIETTKNPSILYMVEQGATTVWEHMGGGNSNNHYVYGAPVKWMYSNILGIGHNYNDGNAGYDHFELSPTYSKDPASTVTWAKGSYDSVNGVIEADWQISEDKKTFTFNCRVPANTSATLSLPVDSENSTITEGGIDISDAEGIEYIKTENGRRYYEITSGVYNFVVNN